MTTTNTATLSNLRAAYRTARRFAAVATPADVRGLLASGYARGGDELRVARMLDRLVMRRGR